MTELAKPEKWKKVIEKANIEDGSQKLIEVGTKADRLSVSVPLEGSEQPSTDISDIKTNSQSYPIARSKSSYSRDWCNARTSRDAPVKRNSKPYKSKGAFANKIEYPSDAPGATLIEQVNKLFADAVHYKSYAFIKKSARYDDELANEVNKVTKKTAVQVND